MIELVFSCSEWFVPYLTVCLKSLCTHIDAKKQYNITILEQNISEQNKMLLSSLYNKDNVVINFFNIAEYLKENKFHAHHHVSIETFFKLFIPQIFDYKKRVLFCDADIIFLDDPQKLYYMDMKEQKLGAALCHLWNGIINHKPKCFQYTTDKLGLEHPEKYFQAGILLYQNNLFTKDDINNLIVLSTKDAFSCMDQDVLNSYFNDKFVKFDSRWNFETAQKVFKEDIPFIDKEHMLEWQKARENPAIIHYSGERKPWFYPDEDFADIWWEYARKTPFYEEILKRYIFTQHQENKIKNYTLKLFNFLPILKKQSNFNKVKYNFLGLPVFKRKNKGNKVKYYFLGLPVWKTKFKGNTQKGYLFSIIPLLKRICK